MFNSTFNKIKDYDTITIILITLNLYDEKYILTNWKENNQFSEDYLFSNYESTPKIFRICPYGEKETYRKCPSFYFHFDLPKDKIVRVFGDVIRRRYQKYIYNCNLLEIFDYSQYPFIVKRHKNYIYKNTLPEQQLINIPEQTSKNIHGKRRFHQKQLFESKKQKWHSHKKRQFVPQRYQIRRNQY